MLERDAGNLAEMENVELEGAEMCGNEVKKRWMLGKEAMQT